MPHRCQGGCGHVCATHAARPSLLARGRSFKKVILTWPLRTLSGGKRLEANGLRVACSPAPAPAGRPVATPPGPPWADPIPVTPASGGTARAHHHRPSRRWMDSRVRVDEMNYYGKSIPEYL